MTYIITPYVFTSAVAAIMALMVAVIAWQRRPATGRSPLIGLMLAVSLWSAGAAMEYATIGIPGKLLWVKPEYIGVLCSPVFFFLLALEYTQQDHWLSPRGRWLLFAPPALVWLLVITNEHHGLIWPTITLAGPSGANLAVYGHGIVFWLGVVAYAYILMLIGTVLLVRAALRFAPIYRRQAILLIAAVLAPWAVNLVYVAGFSPLPGLELTPLVMVFTGTIFAWSIFRFHLLDLAPVARERLIETMADGMLVLDDRERVIDFNPAVQRLLGLDSPIQYGQPVHTLLAGWPQWKATARQAGSIQVQIAAGSAGVRCFELGAAPLAGHRNQPLGRLLVLHDITAIKTAQTEIELLNEELELRVAERTRDLTTSQERFRQVVASISDHVFAFQLSTGGAVDPIYSSPRLAELTGYSSAEMTGEFFSTVAMLTHPEDRAAVNAFVNSLLVNDSDAVEYRTVRADKTIGWLRTSARVQTEGERRIVYGVTSDITARRRMEQIAIENRAMAEVDKLRTELIANVSHELRTPLGLIKMGSTTLLRQDVTFPGEVQRQILQEISRQTDHLAQLVSNLLDMSRIDQNRFVLHCEWTDLNELVANLVGAMQRMGSEAAQPQCSFILKLPQPPVLAQVDAPKFEQVLRNLLENAVRYSPGGGEITVELSGEEINCVLRVADKGIGIAAEEQEHIFERFYRSHDAQVQRVRGAGLGLAICREISRAHGGDIHVISAAGAGATFVVCIPRHHDGGDGMPGEQHGEQHSVRRGEAY